MCLFKAHPWKLGFVSVHPLRAPCSASQQSLPLFLTIHSRGSGLVLRLGDYGRWLALTLDGSLSSSAPSLHLSCLTTDTDWYRGETCEFSTKKSLVYGLVGAVGAVILIVLVIMLVFTFRSRREVKR